MLLYSLFWLSLSSIGNGASKFELYNVKPIPIFIKSKFGNYFLLPSNQGRQYHFKGEEMHYALSVTENVYICSVYASKERWNLFIKLWPNLIGIYSFKCLVIENSDDIDNKDVNLFVTLLSRCYKISDRKNFVKRFSILDKILKLTEQMNYNFVIMNEVWRILSKNSKELLHNVKIKRQINTDHLNLRIIDLNINNILKIQKNIHFRLISKHEQRILIGNFKSTNKFISEYHNFIIHDFIMILQKEPINEVLQYEVNFLVSNSNKKYGCFKRHLFNHLWELKFCKKNVHVMNGSTVIQCICKYEGFVTIVQDERIKDFQRLKPDHLQDYWGFYFPWDFIDDTTKYIKEDEMRYLPFIAVMRLIVVGVATLNLLIFIYLGFVLCMKKKRIFYALETVSVVIFLTCLSISNLAFHLLAYIGLVWIRNNLTSWCSFVTFFHLNYVMSLCTFQCYVFIVSITKHNKWLHNIALPILMILSPVAAGVLDGTATKWINSGSNLRVFNLSPNITLFFIVLPCAVSTLLVPVMAVCTYTIIRRASRLYGFMGTFLFSSIHLVGGLFLVLANTGERSELQFYFQFCIVAIVETVYQSLLAVFLLILSNTNTSLLDSHCTHDLDTRALKKYFDDPKSAIQLKGKM